MNLNMIKEHPEWSEKYSAIDGIAKPRKFLVGKDSPHEEKAIRSDIEEILKLEDTNFNKWYISHKETAEKLLNLYSHFAEIPNLNYGSEEQKCGMEAYSSIKSLIDYFKEGLDYLEKIKQIREEYKN